MVNLFPHQKQALEQTAEQNRVAVKGFEGLYEVDRKGNIFSLRNQIVLKPYKNDCGYMKVNLYDSFRKCKKKYVHRLVAEAFVPNPKNKPEVNRIDCDKQNNSVENLEWCTRKQNLIHSYEHGLKRHGENHGMHKLTIEQVNDIRSKQLTQKEYALKYGVKQCTVSAIQKHRLWKEGDVECQELSCSHTKKTL